MKFLPPVLYLSLVCGISGLAKDAAPAKTAPRKLVGEQPEGGVLVTTSFACCRRCTKIYAHRDGRLRIKFGI